MNRLEPQRVALSLPSLRADTLTPEVMAQIKRVRRTGLTIAPEAGSERLRAVINKNLPGGHYFLSPGCLSGRMAPAQALFYDRASHGNRRGPGGHRGAGPPGPQVRPQGLRPRLNVNLASFIPKSHTPFQWEGQADLAEGQKRLHEVKDLLSSPGFSSSGTPRPKAGWRAFSPGETGGWPRFCWLRTGGCRLDAWSEHLRLEPGARPSGRPAWTRRLTAAPGTTEELLPWDHLDSGVSREFLQEERDRAYRTLETTRTAATRAAGTVAAAMRTRWSCGWPRLRRKRHLPLPPGLRRSRVSGAA